MDNRAALVDFSIYSLPVEEQNAFKTILLVPIGTLVVAIFRILIGLRTSGTFMPILIALAFIQTTLLWGLLLFLIVVGAGLFIRFHLARLPPNGALDATFHTSVLGDVNCEVSALAVQPDGRILIGGVFTNVYFTQEFHV